MPVRNARATQVIHWIPPNNTAAFKVTVTRTNGTIDDITSLIVSLKVNDMATDGIGSFEFEIYDPTELYVNSWNGNEIFNYYKDYAKTATTLRFRGRTEKVTKNVMKLKVIGRSESLKIMNVSVTKSYTDTEPSIILKDIFSSYATMFTTTNINTTTTTMTVNWVQKPFFECVKELCDSAGFEFYVDSGLDAHFFLSGSVTNEAEAMVHTFNIINNGVEDVAQDYSLIRNRVIVYGATIDGVQIIYTADDTTSQSTLDTVKEEIVNDDNVTSYTQAKELGDSLLAQKKDATVNQVGSVKGIMLASIQPGDKILVSAPTEGLPYDLYKTKGYEDEINVENGNLYTKVYINKQPRNITHILRDRIISDNQQRNTSSNPYEMKYSYNFLFNEDSGTNRDTEITNGVLTLASGKVNGDWTSPVRNADANITECSLILIGQTLTGVTVKVSANGGTNFQNITNGQRITMTNTGTQLIVKVTMNDTTATTQIDSLSMQYK